jgi:integrase
MRAPSPQTVAEAAEAWIAKAEAGEIKKRGGRDYKPSVVRGYRADLRRYIVPALGGHRVSQLRRRDVQELLVDELIAEGKSGSKVLNVLNALRAILRPALRGDELALDPTRGLELPEGAGVRDRVASPAEAAELLAALHDEDRALWSCACYAGLRRGELRALRWSDVDLEANVIAVERGWDEHEGEIEPKSRKGRRTVPIAEPLRLVLLEHKARTGRRRSELVFGRTGSNPFTPTHIRKRALKVWGAENAKRREEERPLLEPIGLHELRHTYVSLMHDAGFSLERIGDYVGHSSSYMVDRYRHLIEGHEAEAAERFTAYLGAKTGAQTGAQRLQPAPLSRK